MHPRVCIAEDGRIECLCGIEDDYYDLADDIADDIADEMADDKENDE